MRRSLVGLVLAAMLAGCGPTVEQVCDDLSASCPEIGNDCVDDGEQLDEMASDSDCDDQFSAYLDCLSVATCDWRLQCGEERDAISECVGGLPD